MENITKDLAEIQKTLPEGKTNGFLPGALIAHAIENKGSIEVIEKLMDLQERWERNLAKKSFLEALNKFQAIVPSLEKKKQVRFQTSKGVTQYKYAPLGEIVEDIKSALSETGLSYRWEVSEDNNISVSCIISHLDGHSERTTMTASKDQSGGKNDIQSRGSTITYLQRYTLTTSLGIATADEDNDGRTTETPAKKTAPPAKSAPKVDWVKKMDSCKTIDELKEIWGQIPSENKKKGTPELIKKEEMKLRLSRPAVKTSPELPEVKNKQTKKEMEQEDDQRLSDAEEKEIELCDEIAKQINSIDSSWTKEQLTELDQMVDSLSVSEFKTDKLRQYKSKLASEKIDHTPDVLPF